MKKHKKLTIVVVLFLLLCSGIGLLLCLSVFSPKKDFELTGEILFYIQIDDKDGLFIYDCEKEKLHDLSTVPSKTAVFSNEGRLFIHMGGSVNEYDPDTNEQVAVYIKDAGLFKLFPYPKNGVLSIAQEKSEHLMDIFLYDTETKEKRVLVSDASHFLHSWSDNGELLYYTDSNNVIKSLDISTGEVKEICNGYDAVVRGSMIAYQDKGCLYVRNMETNEVYKYDDQVFDTGCFSPDGEYLVTTGYIPIGVTIKTFLTGGNALGERLFGCSIVVWDYKNNHKQVIVDAVKTSPMFFYEWRGNTGED